MATDSRTPLKFVLGDLISTRLDVLLHSDLKEAFSTSWIQEIHDQGLLIATANVSPEPTEAFGKAAMKVARRLSVDQSFDLEDRIRLVLHVGFHCLEVWDDKQEGYESLQAAVEGMFTASEMSHKFLTQSIVGLLRLLVGLVPCQDQRDVYTFLRQSVTGISKMNGLYRVKGFRSLMVGLAALIAATIPGQQAAVIACLEKKFRLLTTDDIPVSLLRHEFAENCSKMLDSATLLAVRPSILKNLRIILDKLTNDCDQYHIAQRNQWLESAVELAYIHAEIESDQPPEGMHEILAKLYPLMNPMTGKFSLETLIWACDLMEQSLYLRITQPPNPDLELQWYHRRLDIRLVYLFDHAHAGTQPLFSTLQHEYCDHLVAQERISPTTIVKADLPGLDARLAQHGYSVNGQGLMAVLLQLDKNEVRINNNFEMMRRLLQHVKTPMTQQ
eukprot:TRINITY_DN10371_c0_g2_i2.p2 TRINITY_DN10371_c0_g2~~TRINITY_DN10371_c0_g2_i2.p2  ORF type:complete len:444 (+),score=82.43 TRINITY_DN10371_c0_g2_i2:2889-4220(+)